ncbi:hypothetical protein [Terrimonas alba]|uniref:hypothetical protein n=1 Tax=Terrimonas alba TaxID=3349636 RepID=UPI0035F41CC7
MIPLVIALWEHANFQGRKRLFVTDASDLGRNAFNDKTSAIGVHPGPDYAAWKAANGGTEPVVSLYEHVNYGGAALTLKAGGYANIHTLYNFGDKISSLRFNPPVRLPGTIAPIPIYLELYQHTNFQGNRLVVVENSVNIPQDFGSEFNDVASSIRVFRGPNYAQGNKAELFRDYNFLGGKIELDPGDYPNIAGAPYGFNDVVSSIRIR